MSSQVSVKCGFIKDENNRKLKEIFSNNKRLKEVSLELYPINPFESSEFMLLLRTTNKNVLVLNNENRLILKKNDSYKTYFMNVLFSKITECFFKEEEKYFQFILNIQNTYYIITVLN